MWWVVWDVPGDGLLQLAYSVRKWDEEKELLDQVLLTWCWCSCNVFLLVCRQEESLSHHSHLRGFCSEPVLMEEYVFWKLSFGLFNSLPYRSLGFWYGLYFRPPPWSLSPSQVHSILLPSPNVCCCLFACVWIRRNSLVWWMPWGSSLMDGWELFGIRNFERQEEMSCCCVLHVVFRKASLPMPAGQTVTSTSIRKMRLKPTRGCARQTGKCGPNFSSSRRGWPKCEKWDPHQN